jgi:small-conductance mechanosensitive channel
MPVTWEQILLTAAPALGWVLAAAITFRILKIVGRRSRLAGELGRRAHVPVQLTFALITARTMIGSYGRGDWKPAVMHLSLLAIMASVAWLVAVLLITFENSALRRFKMDVADNLIARRVHTQISLVRRITIAVITVLTAGAMLLTFPQARAAGASVLASAGLIGIVAALAAQSMLGNVIAGLQLAFGDALRIDDVVVVEGEWGKVETITLSYVVVKTWDERSLILPTSYFTTNPFQHWTRRGASLLGTAEIDFDWSVPLAEIRAVLEKAVHASEWWDQRVCKVHVTDATGGKLTARVLVSARNSGDLWELRCLVREALVTWTQSEHPAARPKLWIAQA